MSNAEFTKKFKEMDDNWKSRREEGFTDGFVPHPAGTYVQKLTGCKLAKTDDGTPYILTTYVTMEGSAKGKRFADFQRITAERLGFLGLFFTRLEIEPPESLVDIPDLVDQLNESRLIVKQKIIHTQDGDKEYVNGIVISVLDGIDSEADEAEAVEADEAETVEVDIDELKEKLEGYGIELPETDDLDEIIVAANEYDIDVEEEDKELFAELGIGVEAEAEAEAEDNPDLDTLKKLCKEADIAFEEDDTCEVLGERLNEFEWSIKTDKLSKDEVAAMKKYGVDVGK